MGCIIGGNSPHARLECLQGLSMEKFVRLTSVLGINLKPNEDIDYANEPFMPMSPMEALRTGISISNYIHILNLESLLLNFRKLSHKCKSYDWFQ